MVTTLIIEKAQIYLVFRRITEHRERGLWMEFQQAWNRIQLVKHAFSPSYAEVWGSEFYDEKLSHGSEAVFLVSLNNA